MSWVDCGGVGHGVEELSSDCDNEGEDMLEWDWITSIVKSPNMVEEFLPKEFKDGFKVTETLWSLSCKKGCEIGIEVGLT